MGKKFKIKAIVFDFDGTLANTNRLHYDAFRKVLGKRSVDLTEEEMAPLFGVGALKIMKLLKKKYHLKDSAETLLSEKTQAYERIIKTARLRTGAIENLKYLKKKGFKLAVWTGALKKQSKKVLGKQNLDLLSAFIDSTDLDRGKPYPDGLKLIAKKFKVGLENIALIGDSEKDITAARRAGSLPVGIPADLTSELLLKSNPPLIISELKDLRLLFRECPQALET